jgi:transcriptional antiterminator RfaH
MAKHWYALRSKPRKEDTVWEQLNTREIKNYYPRLRVHPVNPRAKKVRPYFPGYLFVRVDLVETGLSLFRWMPHTLGLVTFGGEPAQVPDNLIHAIQKRVEQINQAGGEVLEGLKSGDKIRIEDGPFSGFEAIFDASLPGKERVRVLLTLLGQSRQVPVELDVSQIRKDD